MRTTEYVEKSAVKLWGKANPGVTLSFPLLALSGHAAVLQKRSAYDPERTLKNVKI